MPTAHLNARCKLENEVHCMPTPFQTPTHKCDSQKTLFGCVFPSVKTFGRSFLFICTRIMELPASYFFNVCKQNLCCFQQCLSSRTSSCFVPNKASPFVESCHSKLEMAMWSSSEGADLLYQCQRVEEPLISSACPSWYEFPILWVSCASESWTCRVWGRGFFL